MEVKEFIESGILELFVLDSLSLQEKTEVLDMAQKHAEVRIEIENIERSFESLALSESKEPSNHLYESISQKISFSDFENQHTEKNTSNQLNQANHSDVRIVPLEEDSLRNGAIPLYPVKFYAYALAACFTLLLVSTYSVYNLWTELKVTRNELAAQSKTYGNQVAYLGTELNKSNSTVRVLRNHDFKKLALNGLASHSNTKAVVWWNSKKHTVMIDPDGLPNTDKDHSYQLWAIVKGKPVDAGVFDVKGDLKSVSQLKDIENAQAFAVTLEPRGGSDKPTMSEMYVMANI